jgi:hypothetical protein
MRVRFFGGRVGAVRAGADLDSLRDEDEATHRYAERWCRGGEIGPLGPGMRGEVLFGATFDRWVAIALPGAGTPIVICAPGPAVTVGGGVGAAAEVSRFGRRSRLALVV